MQAWNRIILPAATPVFLALAIGLPMLRQRLKTGSWGIAFGRRRGPGEAFVLVLFVALLAGYGVLGSLLALGRVQSVAPLLVERDELVLAGPSSASRARSSSTLSFTTRPIPAPRRVSSFLLEWSPRA